MTVTRWYNVGQGKSPREAEWSRHVERDSEQPYCYNVGSGAVRQKFEEAQGLSQSELLDRNTNILLSVEYRHWKGRFGDEARRKLCSAHVQKVTRISRRVWQHKCREMNSVGEADVPNLR